MPHKRSSILTFLLSTLFIIIIFGPIALNPNSSFILYSGDGLKNYFTYLYSILYDDGLHFSGMNYPFGEHVVFTDNMPILSLLVSQLSSYYPEIGDYALGIMHYAILLSFPVGSLFLFQTFKLYQLRDSWAIMAALIITFMSPILFKINGHFGMGFFFILPAVIYYMTKFWLKPSVLYLFWISLITLAAGFLHAYHLVISLALLIFFGISQLLFHRRAVWRKALSLILAGFVPVIAFSVFMKLTDSIPDRPDFPYGIFGSASHGADLFTSRIAPLGNWLSFIFGNSEHKHVEGYAFIGIAGNAVLICCSYLLFRWIYFTKVKKQKTNLSIPYPEYYPWLLTAFMALLLGLGFPINSGLQFLIDYIAALRQFRTVGRFSWIFYYIVSIYTFIFLYQAYFNHKKNGWKGFIIRYGVIGLLIISIIHTYGSYTYYEASLKISTQLYTKVMGKERLKHLQEIFNKNNVHKDSFQAILQLPYFHIGSEKLWIGSDVDAHNLFNGTAISLHTGIPIINVKLSRTSWAQTFESAAISDGPFTPKKILNRFNDKKVLLVLNKNIPISYHDSFIIKVAQPLGQWDSALLYSLDIHKWQKHEDSMQQAYRQLAIEQPHNEGLLIHQDAFYYYQHADHQTAPYTKVGKGAHPATQNPVEVVDTVHLPLKLDTATPYTFSAWAKVPDYRYHTPIIAIRQYNAAHQEIHNIHMNFKYSKRVNSFWMLCEIPLTLQTQATYLTIEINNDQRYGSFLALDEWCLYPQNDVLFYKKNKTLYLNNRPVK